MNRRCFFYIQVLFVDLEANNAYFYVFHKHFNFIREGSAHLANPILWRYQENVGFFLNCVLKYLKTVFHPREIALHSNVVLIFTISLGWNRPKFFPFYFNGLLVFLWFFELIYAIEFLISEKVAMNLRHLKLYYFLWFTNECTSRMRLISF